MPPEIITSPPSQQQHNFAVGNRALGFDGVSPFLSRMLAGVDNLNDIRALSPLPDEAQRLIDNRVVQVGLERLTVVADILARPGLTFPLPNWLAVPELYWESSSKVGHAVRTMDPMSRGENQIPALTGYRLPIPCAVDDFHLGMRTLLTARRAGYNIDLSMVDQATRRVNESHEDAFINGSNIVMNGNTSPGLLNAPNANAFVYAGGEAWDAAGKTGPEIITDIQGMIALAQADNRFGPYHLWIPTLYGNKFNEDYVANYPKTIGARVSEIRTSGGPGGRESFLTWSIADRLPANRTILCEMTSDVLDVVYGQAPTAVTWMEGPVGYAPFRAAVIGCIVLRVKTDSASKSGIVIGFTS